MATVTLYGFPPSTFTRTARMVCAELGVHHTLEPLAFRQPAHFALHPFGKMPVLRHGDVVLFETLAIAAYLDDTFGGGRLHGRSALERARVLQWCSAAMDYLYPDVVGALTEAGDPAPQAVQAARHHLKVVDEALAESRFLAGDEVTLADLFLLPMLDFAMNRGGEALAEGFPHVLRWRTALAERDSAKETVA